MQTAEEKLERIRRMVKSMRPDYKGVKYNDYDDGVNSGATRVFDWIDKILNDAS
jgi:lysozyme family protein